MMSLIATPVESYLKSPADILFGSHIIITLPSHYISIDWTASDFLLNKQDKMEEVRMIDMQVLI